MKKYLLGCLLALAAVAGAYAQTAVYLPIAAQTVADIGNGPIKVRVTQGNASIFTSQGSGVGSTAGSSTSLTLTATPATPPIVGGYISGTGITSGTTIAAYNGATSLTLSAAMNVVPGTTLSWGAACPASAAGIPTNYIPASVMADYYLLYTQARVCAISPGGANNALLVLPVFYDSTTPGGGGSGGGAVSSVFSRTGAVVAQNNDYSISQITSGLSNALTSAFFFVGSAGNIATGVAMGGDCTLTNAGVVICTKTNGVSFAASATTDTTNASNIASGTLGSARGGAGAITGALKGNGAGVVSQAACADLSNGVASCSTDTTNASNISSGTLGTGRLSGSYTGITGTGALAAGSLAAGFTAVPITIGGTGQATQQAAFDALAPTATIAGSIAYWNGTHWVKLDGNTSGTKVLQEDASGVPTWASAGAGSVTSIVCNGLTITATGTCPEPFDFENCTITASVATSLLTVALKDNAGADPSATSPCRIGFRTTTATSATLTFDTVSTPLSINTNAVGATLGTSNSTAFRFWVVAFDNGGSPVLALYNASNASGCTPIDESTVQSSTPISGSATAVATYYTPNGTTISSKAVRILGYVEYNATGLATAGTYATAPNFAQTFNKGIRKPCERVQIVYSTTNTTTTVTSSTAAASANTVSITPKSAANLIRLSAGGGGSLVNGSLTTLQLKLRRGTATDIGAGYNFSISGTNSGGPAFLTALDLPNTASAQAYTVYMNSADNVTQTKYPYNTFTTIQGTMDAEEIQG